MKKTIKINLGAVVFHVDEDAYDLLRNYLDQLDARFMAEPGRKEILADIETRMAELFQAKISTDKQVLTLADTREVIDIMGEPEEIGEETQDEEPVTFTRQRGRRGRRMFRDPDNQVIGGVCSGIGAYLNIDPVFIRILFVLFTLAYGIGLLFYFLLWAVVPEARTAAEKLEMSGEEVNVFNLERKVRQEYRQTSGVQGERVPRRRRNFIGNLVRGIGKVILVFFKIIGFIVLGSLAIAGVAVLAALIAAAFGANAWFIDSGWSDNMFRFRDAMELFISPVGGTLGFIALILLVAIPVLGLIYGLGKLIFRFRANDRAVGFSSFGVWIIALIVLLVIGISEGMQYSNRATSDQETELLVPEGKVLYIKSLPEPSDVYSTMTGFNDDDDFRISKTRDSISLLIRPKVHLDFTRDTAAGIRIVRRAHGPNYSAALRNAEEIPYTCQVADTVLAIDPFYRVGQKQRFHVQQVEVNINLPEGTRIYLDKNLEDLLYAVRNTEDTWSSDLVGREWIMTSEGLSPITKNLPAGGI